MKVLGQLATMVTYNDWTCKEACLTVVVEDGHKLIIRRDLFNSLGLAVVQQQAKSGKCVNNNNSACKIKESVASQFPHLVLRKGLSKTHVVK